MRPRIPLALLERALLPPRCVLCDLASDTSRDLCRACAADLAAPRSVCLQCGEPVAIDAAAWPCGRCQRRPPPWDLLVARCHWGPAAAALVHDLKFRGRTACARVMAELMAERPPPDPDRAAVLVPVPLHWRRRWHRGFDQTVLISRQLSRITGLQACCGGLSRHRATAPQSGLDAVRRRRSPRGAFRPGRCPMPEAVVLVDDVTTTGATLAAAARACRRGGARRVTAWVFAHSPQRRGTV